MKKHGFTLTELMIVIVITGLLTAVSVPKLATVIAKAKASELAPAATSYSKLQAAYLYERKAFGTWKKIGYKAPGKKGLSETFVYSSGDITKTIRTSSISKELSGDGKISWQAENITPLGNCQKGNLWKIKAIASSDTEIEFRAYIEPSTSSTDCIALANDWANFRNQVSMNTPPGETVVAAATPGTPGTPTGGDPAPEPNTEITPSGLTKLTETFHDEETGLTENDDGSCGVKVTSAGDVCPPSWCKLNGNVSRNHGGWSNAGHKWNECYAARQELIQEAKNQNLITCKNDKNCKLTTKGSTVVINGRVISGGGYNDDEYAVEGNDPIVYTGLGRENAERALGGDVMCVEDQNDNKCQQWRAASDCEYPSKNNKTCNGWKT